MSEKIPLTRTEYMLAKMVIGNSPIKMDTIGSMLRVQSNPDYIFCKGIIRYYSYKLIENLETLVNLKILELNELDYYVPGKHASRI